mmetsp:Transcript_3419/g.7584  ORF Transcript_3419/g.7584 Transcript_3419/m.7584 type:complete len:86 (-) Transcript_3419:541-798(-)
MYHRVVDDCKGNIYVPREVILIVFIARCRRLLLAQYKIIASRYLVVVSKHNFYHLFIISPWRCLEGLALIGVVKKRIKFPRFGEM